MRIVTIIGNRPQFVKAAAVSDRLRNLVVYALQGRYEVEAVTTEAQNHATEIGRELADQGYDIVVDFGADGTLNEVANGLAGPDGRTAAATRAYVVERQRGHGDRGRRAGHRMCAGDQ